jgi:nicotinamide mononucleotide (NMN) deamidase PncC
MAKFDVQALVKNYAGPKLRLLMTGVGSYATGIIGIPGSSSLIDSIYIPYSRESVAELIERLHPNASDVLEKAASVSQEMVVALHLCNSAKLKGELPVTITGAITTSRYRRGENHAFIAFGSPSIMEVYHLKLDKLEEADHADEHVVARKRYVQDRMVSETALAMATGTQSDLVDELQTGGFLVRL